MIIHFLSMLTAILIPITGVIVIAMGDWHPFRLKYAPIVISTITGAWLFTYMLFNHSNHDGVNTYQLIGIFRNIAFVLFHIAIGRDSIQYKNKDRRSSC